MKSLSRGLLILLALFSASASQAAIFTTRLTGPNEFPPNASPGTGDGTVNFDLLTHTFSIDVSFSGLSANTTVAHLHCCVPPVPPAVAPPATQVPSFADFPVGVTSGSYSHTFDTLDSATWNPAFVSVNGGTVAGAEAALAAGLSAGTSYLNIHTTAFPGGEIRGFLTAATTSQVPEPPAVALFALAIGALVAARRKRV